MFAINGLLHLMKFAVKQRSKGHILHLSQQISSPMQFAFVGCKLSQQHLAIFECD